MLLFAVFANIPSNVDMINACILRGSKYLKILALLLLLFPRIKSLTKSPDSHYLSRKTKYIQELLKNKKTSNYRESQVPYSQHSMIMI